MIVTEWGPDKNCNPQTNPSEVEMIRIFEKYRDLVPSEETTRALIKEAFNAGMLEGNCRECGAHD